MHTVIILDKRSSDLLGDFQFLFMPFIDEGIISFCYWNESGTDIPSSVPDLYKTIKGKENWRAVILHAQSTGEQPYDFESDPRNPFDFIQNSKRSTEEKESDIPLVRLCHMLGGYPLRKNKEFERAFLYQDEFTGGEVRVREADLSIEELQDLMEQYGERLKSVYMEKKLPKEQIDSMNKLVDKYYFEDSRPTEIILLATRRHFVENEKERIANSWVDQPENASSLFWERNNYPDICRFLYFNLNNREHSQHNKELIEFWLGALTLAINKIQPNTLQAYRLYRLKTTVSAEELQILLNCHLNKLNAAYNFVQDSLRRRPEYTFNPEEEMVKPQTIPVIFEQTDSKDLYVNTKNLGLAKDCPEDEAVFWFSTMKEKRQNLHRYLKAPKRAIDVASEHARSTADKFLGEEYELDKFQIEDLNETIENLEWDIITSKTRNILNTKKFKEDMNAKGSTVTKYIEGRMKRRVVITTGIIALLLCFMGYLPYLTLAYKKGSSIFIPSFILALFALALVSMGGFLALFILKRRLKSKIGEFNSVMHNISNQVNSSAKSFEDYLSKVCTYMKAQAIFSGIRLKDHTMGSKIFLLKSHRNALRQTIERNEEWVASYHLQRTEEVEVNVPNFFDPCAIPKENSIYRFSPSLDTDTIPINTAGDMVRPPYCFVSEVLIHREQIYEFREG